MQVEKIIESLKKHEGFRDKVYQDSLGVATIGYGFAIKDLELDEHISGLILDQKVRALVYEMAEQFDWFPWLPDPAQNVIIEMCYQLGVAGVGKFINMIAALGKEKWETAADEMLDSRWAIQTPKRANEMAMIIRLLPKVDPPV